ncbi:MAG TPA: hypothetical protein VFG68_10700 [Fimbriiglobus sp.]|nr:hypothetical protein [Fimbriiglobus sp.]
MSNATLRPPDPPVQPGDRPLSPIRPRDYQPGPFRRLLRALLAAERADRRHHKAQITSIGDTDRRRVLDAEWDRLRALEHVAEVRDQIASDWLLGLRLALHLYPERVVELLRQADGPEVRR